MIVIPLHIDGKNYNIKGIGNITLFPIAKLSQALTDVDIPRDTQTIRKWEVKGVIPPSIFRSGGKRLFSKEQIDCIVRVAKECDIKQGNSIASTEFIQKVWDELSKINTKYIAKMKGK